MRLAGSDRKPSAVDERRETVLGFERGYRSVTLRIPLPQPASALGSTRRSRRL